MRANQPPEVNDFLTPQRGGYNQAMARVKSKKELSINADICRVGAERQQFIERTPHERRDAAFHAEIARFDEQIRRLYKDREQAVEDDFND